MPDEPVALAHIKLAWHCAVLASICADVTPISATAMLVLRSMLGERRGRWQRASAEALVKKRCGGPRASVFACRRVFDEHAWSSLRHCRHQGAIPALDRLFRARVGCNARQLTKSTACPVSATHAARRPPLPLHARGGLAVSHHGGFEAGRDGRHSVEQCGRVVLEPRDEDDGKPSAAPVDRHQHARPVDALPKRPVAAVLAVLLAAPT